MITVPIASSIDYVFGNGFCTNYIYLKPSFLILYNNFRDFIDKLIGKIDFLVMFC